MNANESIRTFIAIELPQEIKNNLRELQTRLTVSDPQTARWVNPNSIHLTLKFLGDTSRELIPSIVSFLDQIATQIPPFNLSVTKVGAFPNLNRIRVIWVGLGGNLDILNQLQKNIETKISPLGFPTEDRAFTAHLTLARIRETATLQEKQILAKLISGASINPSPNFTVDTICLIQSRLTPSGAIYTDMHSAKLNSSCA
jgi:RNA 2',3'-cyclic 3'-phosphodiesterase